MSEGRIFLMKKTTLNLLAIVSLVSTFLFLFTACLQKPTDVDESEARDPNRIQLSVIHQEESIPIINLAKAVLTEKMNMTVLSTQETVDAAFSKISTKNSDVLLDAWLPLTHQTYMERYGDQLDQLGTIFTGGRIGLVVPEYVNINSIEDLKQARDQFNGQILAFNTDSGVLEQTDQLMNSYELDFEVFAQSPEKILETLENSIENEEWVVVTGFRPHWKFNTWNLKFLQDPQGIFGEEQTIVVLARKGLAEDHPEVAEFFNNFSLNDEQLEEISNLMHESEEDPYNVAVRWINENSDVVDNWITNS
jgi:glycine betaine/proline transport system substrate-binding protein